MNQSVILTSHLDASTSGAVAEPAGVYGHDDASRQVAWHYGDPLGEQRAATTSTIIVDRSDRAVLEVSGEERLSWLHTISSQFISDLPDRHSAENLSLDLNGRIVEHFVLTDIDGVTWIDTLARAAPNSPPSSPRWSSGPRRPRRPAPTCAC